MSDSTPTRRSIVKTVAVGGITVSCPGFVDVASAETYSRKVELTTTSTIPDSCSIDITVYEDTSGDGSADNSQSKTIEGGEDVTATFGGLDSYSNQSHTLWLEIAMSTSNDTVTPELESATLTLPENQFVPTETPVPIEQESQGVRGIWDNYLFYVTAIVAVFSGVGMASRSLAIGALGGFLAFAYIALETGTSLFTSILYVTLVLVFIGFAFKLWRLEFGGS